ncbi:Gamma-aminobutyric acid (GABA) B receptor [Seminavis robusta]|uniref:Gamma-aminobutyric acid (GABA) B receptor n=1 Tax=Seminavis robusta TaxID=568900 RepID=A0A9N8EE30_9STRA|nr:Gamma-aminobutyric acid (GABA) B receptor [Seminavis robusta]|eukprot:Sro941_g222660.1 Gamma-aminobutyric acid (GABA) B receptor (1364) ;mRNA; f:28749-33031
MMRTRPCTLLFLSGLLLALHVSVSRGTIEADGACSVLTMVPFTDQTRTQRLPPPNSNNNNNETSSNSVPSYPRWPPTLLANYAYSYMAAAQLAMDHFNARDTTVVPELSQLQDCAVYFPPQVVVDSGFQDTRAVMSVLTGHHGGLIQSLKEKMRPPPQRQLATLQTQRRQQQQQNPPPPNSDNNPLHDAACPDVAGLVDQLLPRYCAILGPRSDRSVNQVAALTGALDIPQLLYGSQSPMAIDPTQTTSTIGVNLSVEGRAKAIVSYLQRQQGQDELQRNYLAMVYRENPLFGGLERSLREFGKDMGLKVVSVEADGGPGGSRLEAARKTVEKVHRTGIKTVLLALDDPADLANNYAVALQEQGMFTKDNIYLLLEEAVGTSDDSLAEIFGMQEPNSPIDNLLNGAVVISAAERVVNDDTEQEDPFMTAWKTQNASMVEYLNELAPVDDTTGEKLFQAEPSYFQDTKPEPMASFIYDSVMAAGFGACAYNGEKPPRPQEEGQQQQRPPQLPEVEEEVPPQEVQELATQLPPVGELPEQIIQQGATQLPPVEEDELQSPPQSQDVATQIPPVDEGQLPPPPQDGQQLPSQMPEGQQLQPPPQQGQQLPPQMPEGQQPPPPPQGEQPPQQQGQGAIPPPGDVRMLRLVPPAEEIDPDLGYIPTVERLFRRISSAFSSMEQSLYFTTENETDHVSRVQVSYNDTYGYPQRVLIVYERVVEAEANESATTYDDTYFATVTDLVSVEGSDNRTGSTPAPSIKASTAITTGEDLTESQQVFSDAVDLWNSHDLREYTFQYDLFFDSVSSMAEANRQTTPYPWTIVVRGEQVASVTDSNGTLLLSPDPPSPGNALASNNSSNNPTLNETLNASSTTEPSVAPSLAPPTEMPSIANAAVTTSVTTATLAPIVTQSSAPEGLSENQGSGSTNVAPDNNAPPLGMPGPQNGGGTGMQRTLVTFILESAFTGASGRVGFGAEAPRGRDTEGVTSGAFNIRPSSNSGSGLRTYTSTLTSYTVLPNLTESNEWKRVPNETFVYRDGDTAPPTLLREIHKENFLSKPVHIVGMTLFATALFLSMVAASGVRYLSDDRVVRCSQPPFLYLLCFGSAMMSAAIFTLSWDESYGWSQQQLDVACTLTPWFFFVGHLLCFSSLFTKLWRVDKVLQFSRRKVKIVQVIVPLVLLLLAAVIVLSVWTAIDPWVWERSLINESPPETYGECTSEHTSVFFFLLAGLMVLGKVATAAMAWKTADIPQDFSDTSSVFYALSTHLQAWFIGLPILVVLGNDSVDATYFGRVLLIWVFSVSGVSLVVLPKIVKAVRIRMNPHAGRADRVRVTISGMSAPPTNSRASHTAMHQSQALSGKPESQEAARN